MTTRMTATLVMAGIATIWMSLGRATELSQLTQTDFVDSCNSLIDAAKDSSKSPSVRKQSGQSALECLSRAQTTLNTAAAVTIATTASPSERLAAINFAAKISAQLQKKQTKVSNNTAAATAQSNFLGLNWGLGVGYAFGQGPRRVTASVVNNIVRVSSDVTDGPRVFLEAHFYPEQWTFKSGNFGWGPFAAVEAGSTGSTSSNGITGFGLGLMMGWKVPSTTNSSGFNIGVGYLWEGSVQTLGDGIVANHPLPTGETQIRYKDQSVGAIAVLFSWKFGHSIPST